MAEVMDDATAATILAVQLQDIQELDSDNGNQCRTIDCDAQLACRIYQEDLERQVRSLRDRHMAIRFGESPLDNEELPIASLPSIPAFHPLDSAESRTAPEKRTDPYDVNQQSEELDAPPIVCLQPGAIEQERPSRKRKATSPPPPTCKLPKLSDPETEDNCIACMSTILPNDLIRLSCEHSYCMECMVRLFTLAMTDETIFPPQCCGASIPLAKVQSQVTTQFENAFKERQVELGTQTSDRTYCSNQTCSIFLPTKTEDLRDDRATCPKCHTQTCIICKCGAHEGGYCSQDPTVVSLLETAAAEGYKQCPSCHLVIELTFGCHHMTYVWIFQSPCCYQCLPNISKMSLQNSILLQLSHTMETLPM